MPVREATAVQTLTISEAAVLALLAIEGERSPYDLMKCVSGAIGYIWAPAKTQLYAILPRLERDGLARSRSARDGGRPEKQLYSLTPAGRSALDTWLAEEPSSTDAFYLKLFVGKLAPPEVLRGHLQWFRETTGAQLEQFRALEQVNSRTGHNRFHWFLLRLGLEHAEHLLEWTDWVERELDAEPA